MEYPLASRNQFIQPSPTLQIAARAAALKASGRDVISLSLGEPDFDTPDFIKTAAIAAINAGFTKYTAVDGIPGLKQAIIQKFARENKLSYQPSQIMVSCGAKQAIFNLAQALLQAGDEVIIPAPYWVSYPDIVAMTGAKPVFIFAGIAQQYLITPEQLEAAITPRTRLLLINSPSNPTGMVYKYETLKALGEVLKRHPHVLIATDDIYEHIRWDGQAFVNILNVCPELVDRTLVINGVSKSYAMTGWRIGYAAGPADIIQAMANIQSQSTSSPCSISQKAAEAALNGGTDCMQPMLDAFKARHDRIIQGLNQLPGVHALPADGAFYAFPSMHELIKRMAKINVHDDVELAEYLLNEANIALVPGSAFGAPGYVRLSFATSITLIDKALERLHEVLKVYV